MRILFIGDIMGRSGRKALETHLPSLRDTLKPDVVIVNGENAAGGAGITSKICKEFYDLGVNVITTGNHVWDQREIIFYIDKDKTLLRPINFPAGTQGRGMVTVNAANGKKITVVNAMARLFMDPLDDPFAILDTLLQKEQMGRTTSAIFVDFHGEATSEKMSLAHYLDGRVSAVVGTHTHIPTADHHIMEHGTAYQSDAGMTGDYDSVIGIEKSIGVHRFVKKIPGERKKAAGGEGTLCGTFIITDDATGLAQSIDTVRVGGLLSQKIPSVN